MKLKHLAIGILIWYLWKKHQEGKLPQVGR